MKPEATVQKHIVELMRDKLGFSVWDTSQGYRKEKGGTRITPGLPDLVIIGWGHVLFVEVKTPWGKETPGQMDFRMTCEANGGESVVWRSDGDAWDWCVGEGIIEDAEQVVL